LNVNGRSIVNPAVLTVFVPDVAANVIVFVDDETAMPVENFRFPYMVTTNVDKVPPKPVGFVPSVKSILRIAPAPKVASAGAVPAESLNEMLLASVTAVGLIVLEVALELVQIIKGVPVTVMVVAPVKIVPVLFNVIVFAPKASVPVKPVQVKVWMSGLMSSVTEPAPEEASNITSSIVLGTGAPETPPESKDQLVVLFQLPVPPVTQYLFAMIIPQQAHQPQVVDSLQNHPTCRNELASWPQSQHPSGRGYPLDAVHPKSR
jgi:hypothetical protein